MKTKNLFMASVLCLAGNFAIGAVLTVDNNPTSNAQYSSIPAAIDAANDFDTLLVQPNTAGYGSFQINKPLVVIGRGHNPEFGRVLAGELTISSSNVIIEGFRGGVSNTLTLSSSLSNIIVRNCRYDFLYILSNCDNILIYGNVINQFLAPIDGSNNILVLNNILNGVGLFVGDSENIIFKNNIIRTSNNLLFNTNSSLATFTDNIFYLSSPAHFNIAECTNCSFQNNLTFSPGGPVAASPNTTLNNVAPTWDLNGLNSPAFNYSINYEMLSGAPATGASDGGQVGIYGAGFNFEMNGFPVGIPRVTSTNIVNPVVFPDGEIEVDFEAEAGSN